MSRYNSEPNFISMHIGTPSLLVAIKHFSGDFVLSTQKQYMIYACKCIMHTIMEWLLTGPVSGD